jgi:glycosyltransferase involved in cell wall biosynthesis
MRILFTVTNDLNYDQRMIRICHSLCEAGHYVKLIGVQFQSSAPLQGKKYFQKRIKVSCKKGFGFYAEYNLKLFFYLLFQKSDIFCCIDLDTMLPAYLISVLKKKTRVYDAHEYFSQQKEIIRRPGIYKFWHFVEKRFVPKFKNGYTVSEGIANALNKNYKVNYEVIRNLPLLKILPVNISESKIILYRGNVNEGRGFEFLIPAMKNVEAHLIICGNGNFFEQAKSIVLENDLQDKVEFRGRLLPDELDEITSCSFIGINLVEPFGQNQILSLANKFFDYIQNELPQLTMNFPGYKKINDEFEVAVLLNDLSVDAIADSLNTLLADTELYSRLKKNCNKAREIYNWQNEEKKLLNFYSRLNK